MVFLGAFNNGNDSLKEKPAPLMPSVLGHIFTSSFGCDQKINAVVCTILIPLYEFLKVYTKLTNNKLDRYKNASQDWTGLKGGKYTW